MLRAIGLLNLKQRCKPAESIPQTFELLNFYGKSPPPPLPHIGTLVKAVLVGTGTVQGKRPFM